MYGKKLGYEELIDVIWGATLLGGGGGGSTQNGLQMLEMYKKTHGEPALDLISADQMDGGLAAVTAGMGSPAAIEGIDFTPYAVNAFELLQEVARSKGKDLKYCIPVELGGFNTFVPMMISLLKKIPFVDADGSGRAVPALETLLLHVNGCATSPLAMSNGDKDKIIIDLADAHNAALAEKLGRDVCVEFGMKSGLSGWMVTEEDVKNRIVEGSISLVQQVGRICRELSENPGDIFKTIGQRIMPAKKITEGRVTEVVTKTEQGFDFGYVTVESGNGIFQIDFQNENLLLSLTDKDKRKKKPIMTAPDIICMHCIEPVIPPKTELDVRPGMPLSNADVKKGMIIGLGVMKVDEKWFQTPHDHWWGVWTEYLERVGYRGDNIPFEDVKEEG